MLQLTLQVRFKKFREFNIKLHHQLPPLNKPAFLYLTNPEWASSWIDGGDIPVSPASKYKSDLRIGTQTPDELETLATYGYSGEPGHPLDETAQEFAANFVRNAGVGRIKFEGDISYEVNGKTGSLAGAVDFSIEDSLILSFASILSAELADRLQKKSVVRIKDPIATYNHISEQLGKKGKIEFVEYTKGPERNAFLKSCEDGWQQEIRMSWPFDLPEERWVNVPAGTAELVDLTKVGEPRRLETIPFPDYDKRTAEENLMFQMQSLLAFDRLRRGLPISQ